MLGKGRSHRFDHRQIIRHSGQMGEEGADPMSAFSVLLEFPLGLQDCTNIIKLSAFQFSDGSTGVLPIVFFQNGFVIKGIHVGGRPIHVQKDHTLRFGWKVWRLGSHWIDTQFAPAFRGKSGEGNGAKPIGAPLQHIPAVGWAVEKVLAMHVDILLQIEFWQIGLYFKWKLKKLRKLKMEGLKKTFEAWRAIFEESKKQFHRNLEFHVNVLKHMMVKRASIAILACTVHFLTFRIHFDFRNCRILSGYEMFKMLKFCVLERFSNPT